uniref:Uncharacterized protein n=1 Tax=Glossina brevipalpis TaxID=37001 RepID=A0A1A9WLA2_9MUSC
MSVSRPYQGGSFSVPSLYTISVFPVWYFWALSILFLGLTPQIPITERELDIGVNRVALTMVLRHRLIWIRCVLKWKDVLKVLTDYQVREFYNIK